MTRSFATNAKNDLVIGPDGNLLVADGIDAVGYAAANAAKAVRGEMMFAADQGVPYFQTVWSARRNVAQFEAALRQRLLAVEGVSDITDLTTAVRGDTVTYAATLKTAFGLVAING